jgi:glycosyltransferase involved in cell wall biosynthesis
MILVGLPMPSPSANSDRAPAAAAPGARLDRDGAVQTAVAMTTGLPERAKPTGFATQRTPTGSVAILLCTRDGGRFLPLQLASYEIQDHADWRLFASDDGSTDNTLALLTEFQRKHGADRVQIRRGPQRGLVVNFLSLICDPSLQADCYALSDQDDVWAVDKLSRARSILMSSPSDVPSIYCSRARLIDEQGAKIGLTPLFRKPLHFRNALVQNVAIGNTTVFNEKLRGLLMQAGPDVGPAVHDWWIYLLTTAVGGKVFYDPYPSVDYRIHSRNLIGTNVSRARKGPMLLKRFKAWNDSNMQALARIESSMLPENRKTFALFRQCRGRSLLPRICGIVRAGVYREKMSDNVGLILAALAGQI